MKQNKLNKVFSIFMAILMMFVVATPVLAQDISDPLTNLTVHKLQYELIEGDATPSIQNTGAEIELPQTVKPWDNTKNGTVGFTIYKLNSSLIEGKTLSPQEIANNYTNYDPTAIGSEVIVSSEQANLGQANFDNLQEGYYVIVETTSPQTATTKSANMFVALPLTNLEGTGYEQNVHLYPKNQLTPVVQELTKLVHRNGTDNAPVAYEGATFELYSGTPGNGTLIQNSEQLTDTEGKISVTDLTVGSYYFVETLVATTDQTKSETLDHNNVLIKPEFTNTASNRLTFVYNTDGTITYPEGSLLAEGQQVVNYETPSIEKEIVEDTDKVYAVGDTIQYKLTIPTPHDVNTYTEFKVQDVAAIGLTVDSSSISIEGKTLDVDYTVATSEDGTISINFVPTNLTNGEDIVITYTGLINEKAVIGETQNNTATLLFNNGYETGSDKDEENVVTYGHTLKKVDTGIFGSNLVQTPLQGAEFVIKNEAGKFLLVAENSRTWVETQTDATIFTTNEDGLIKLTGLDLGNYTAVEIKAPVGYQLPTNPETEFTITGIAEGESTWKMATTEITNTKLPDMPMTGSEKVVLVVSGLVALLVIALVLGKKSKKEEVR